MGQCVSVGVIIDPACSETLSLSGREENMGIRGYAICDKTRYIWYTFCMDRTIVVQLKPAPEQAQVLRQTIQEHTDCFNAVATLGFTTKCSNGIELHKQTYYDLRALYPKLPAQLVCASRVKATEAVKSALDRQKKGRKTGVPHSKVCPIRYDGRSY